MKMRNKGKVHPSNADTSFPVLQLLPAAILSLLSILSLEDREVLAYMITRSLKSIDKQQQQPPHGHKSPPLFDCDCFHCYTSFWFRWDSSPNRELIHQALEAFEDHFTNGEPQHFNRKSKKRKDKIRKRVPVVESPESPAVETAVAIHGVEQLPAAASVRNHKGLARKVLPDVMGIFSSRLWSLWSPNV